MSDRLTTTRSTAMAACMLALAGCEKYIPEYALVASVAACADRSCRVLTEDGRHVTVSGPTATGDTIYRYSNWDSWMVRE